MLGVSGLMGSSGDGAADGGGASGGSSEAGGGGGAEEIERSGGGNRWPRQETLALLKIRSDMDVTFRDSSLKGPLWEEVSRKMAELGYQRSAKKCKEKFENVYKYHKRTKDGRSSKSDGKNYRFFDQLAALENIPPPPPPRPAPPHSQPPPPPMPTPMITVPSNSTTTTSPNPVSIAPPANVSLNPIYPPSTSFQLPSQPPPIPMPNISNSTSTSSTSSDEDVQQRRGKKRKWKDFFQTLMTDVVRKQEDLHKKFLETLERRERDRVARDEAWRVQETARLNREHELLVQERSIAAAKDAAVIAFLQKITDHQNLQVPFGTNTTTTTTNNNNNNDTPPSPSPAPPPPPPAENPPPPLPQPIAASPLAMATPAPIAQTQNKISETTDNGTGKSSISASSSRWPKAEVQALINLRTSLDLKYQDNGPKGPLWEEISTAMSKLGYSRSSKRCKEKWENINKYFKKVKESNKKRPEDSKTCPYFHQLEQLYKEKSRNDVVSLDPIMARPEQQWPVVLSGQPNVQQQAAAMQPDGEHDDDDSEDEDEEDEGGGYEVVANKAAAAAVTNAAE